MKTLLTLLALGLLLPSCASVRMVKYSGGTVTTSTVTYRYVAPPPLKDVSGLAYLVRVSGVPSPSVSELRTLRKHGMRRTGDTGTAAMIVEVVVKDPQAPEAGGMGFSGKYYPALIVKAGYEVTLRNASGARLGGHAGVHEEVLTVKGAPAFPTREEAAQATEFIQRAATDRVDELARQGALKEALKNADGVVRGLFEEQTIAVEVPLVRSVPGAELEEAYQLVASAKSPDQVRTALRMYERAGAQRGGNRTTYYGIACGIAACKLMLRDLGGAWESAKTALTYEPNGGEAQEIRRIVYHEEVTTGLSVIPATEREELDRTMKSAQAWGKLFQRLAD